MVVYFPSFQLGTFTLAGWLVGGKSCLSVRVINRSTFGFPNALAFCGCCVRARYVTTFTSVIQRRFAIRVDSVPS